MRGFIRLVLLALTCVLIVPAAARAQASIAGVVKDSSGAVLPGVTVEVASPALIEKTREAVTDGTGQYKIVSLLPGLYSVTFTLPGFQTFKREGIELAGSFVATVTAEMKVGAVAETITVTGETPLVDVQSATVQKVVTKEVVDAIPTGRLGINLAALTPGIILGAGGGAGVTNTNTLTAQDVGGTSGDTFTDLSIHGSKPSEQRQTIGGVSAATIIRFGESLSSSPSFTAMQEMSVDTAGADASLAGGGVRLNYIPRDGGNAYKGLLFFTGANSSMQATNYTTGTVDAATGICTPVEALQCRGLRTQPGAVDKIYDFNPGFGGPLKKDKVWWFATVRWTAAKNTVPQNYPNKNFVVGKDSPFTLNNTTLTYNPDVAVPLRVNSAGDFKEQTLRISWQITQKNKLSVYYNNKKRITGLNPNTTTSYEALNYGYFFPFSDQLLNWSAPITNKLLLEAGVWHHQETWGGAVAPFDQVDPLAIGVTDTAPVAQLSGYTQLITQYHGRVGNAGAYTPSHNPNTRGSFAVSYVTGQHQFKTGFDLANAERGFWTGAILPYSIQVNTLASNGRGAGIPVPSQILMNSYGCVDPYARIVNGQTTRPTTTNQADVFNYGCPTFQLAKLDLEAGLFVQDRFTMDRVTVSLGVRFDSFDASQPQYHLDPSLITPNRNYDVPEYKTQAQRDITPKIAAAWDVFGNGKTALKVNLGKYVLGQALSAPQLSVTSNSNVVLTATRSWVDNNSNFIPDCDLTNPAAQGPAVAGSGLTQVDTCGVVTGAGALMYSPVRVPLNAADEDARYGWGKRSYSWEFAISAQRELTRGVSINGGYFRRWFGNFLVTDDLSHAAADYDRFSISQSAIPVAPASAGGATLPSGIYTTDFFNQKVGTAAGSNNFIGRSDTFFPGSSMYDHWNGFEFGVNARLAHGIIFQGGFGTGKQVTDNCDIVDPANIGKFGDRTPLVELLATPPVAGTFPASLSSCHVEQAWLTQAKFLGSYTVPKIEVQIGATYQSIPGIEWGANYADSNSDLARPVAQGGLGRLPFGQSSPTATTTIAILPPAAYYGDRLNQLDFRVGKVLRMGRTRAVASLDMFNLFNINTLTSASNTYSSASWLGVSNVVAPRLMKVSVTFDF
jgi:hypothetical protein